MALTIRLCQLNSILNGIFLLYLPHGTTTIAELIPFNDKLRGSQVNFDIVFLAGFQAGNYSTNFFCAVIKEVC